VVVWDCMYHCRHDQGAGCGLLLDRGVFGLFSTALDSTVAAGTLDFRRRERVTDTSEIHDFTPHSQTVSGSTDDNAISDIRRVQVCM